MTLHLQSSFQTHLGRRGCHFYDEKKCTFLDWVEVLKFIKNLPGEPLFAEKLAETLANYDPQKEYLAVRESNGQVAVELYLDISG